jgi:hypothetical protein
MIMLCFVSGAGKALSEILPDDKLSLLLHSVLRAFTLSQSLQMRSVQFLHCRSGRQQNFSSVAMV